ncbi:hypothetical protein NQ318_013686 [Aromia moschata]|uniref:Nucleoside phosphorylase domain-containing protein n=1 Tax=Aromia moschata TaxID=1265417 RepID=A0AAV8Z875_9CUCU|nr:hypothetical protein NQ318_013686 [Aromia moschata]
MQNHNGANTHASLNGDDDVCRYSDHFDSDNEVKEETGNEAVRDCGKKLCIIKKTRYSDGTVRLRNPNIELMDQDILYHLALGSESHDLVEMFGDVKGTRFESVEAVKAKVTEVLNQLAEADFHHCFQQWKSHMERCRDRQGEYIESENVATFVCMGGTPKRMETFAFYIMKEIGHKLPTGTTLTDISQYSYRYSMYKVGPVLSISHGMGVPSIGILLHEIIKLMYHARCKDPIFFRIGTSGGIGIEGGTVVISEKAVDGLGNDCYQVPMLGKIVKRPALLDKRLSRELKALAHPEDPYETVIGTTMCADDFYEGQGRLDGAFCEYTESDKMVYLQDLQSKGVKNIEMEAIPFAALTHHAGIRAADICVTFLDRLKGDQVSTPKEVLNEWQRRPQELVARYIKKYLQTKGRISFDGHGSVAVKSPRRFKLVQQESQTFE